LAAGGVLHYLLCGHEQQMKERVIMSTHPLNLALRFLLELAALGAMGYWGWTQHDGAWRWIAALGVPLIAALLWMSFRVIGDQERMVQSFRAMGIPSADSARSPAGQKTPIAVPGVVRLLVEAVFFGGAVLLLALAGQSRAAAIFGAVVALHYLTSYDRVQWLLAQR